MTSKETININKYLDNQKYIICCPLCDNEKCVKGSDKCEAEIWKKEKLNDRATYNPLD